MVSAGIIKRFVAQIKEKHKEINEPTIEKDFYLTLLLNEISKNIDRKDKSPFSKLVFKGGTLLNLGSAQDVKTPSSLLKTATLLLDEHGIYEVGNPFFYNRIQLTFTKDKILLNKDILTDILNITVKEKKIADQTKIGFLKGIFSNLEEIGIKENEEIKDIKKLSINDFFTELEKEVKLYYKNQKG